MPKTLVIAVLLALPFAARAEPSAEAKQELGEAFRACDEAQRAGKIDLPLFKRYMESRAKAVRLDASIRSWTGRIEGKTVNARFEECEALFQKALADSQKADSSAKPSTASTASADDEREVIAWGQNGADQQAHFLAQYRDMIKNAGGSSQPSPAMVESHFRDIAALRESMAKKVPGWAKLKTTKAAAGHPVGTEMGVLLSDLEAELKKAQAEGAKTVAKNDAASKAESKKIEKQMADAYKRWTSRVKGDRLKVLKKWPAVPGEDSEMNAPTWRFTQTNGADANCDFVYHFKGDTLVDRKVEGPPSCRDAREP